MRTNIALACVIVLMAIGIARMQHVHKATMAKAQAVATAEITELEDALERMQAMLADADTALADAESRIAERDEQVEALQIRLDTLTDRAQEAEPTDTLVGEAAAVPSLDTAPTAQHMDTAIQNKLRAREIEARAILAQIRRCEALGRAAESNLAHAKANRGIYRTITHRIRCSQCGGTGQITIRHDSHTEKRRCDRCGGDGTYTRTERQRVGTKSIDAEVKTVEDLAEAYDKLKHEYVAKMGEVNELRTILGLPALPVPDIQK